MKRSFKFNGTDVELEIKKAVSIDTPKKMVVLEEMKSGEYRLTYSKSLFPDGFDKIENIEIVRED